MYLRVAGCTAFTIFAFGYTQTSERFSRYPFHVLRPFVGEEKMRKCILWNMRTFKYLFYFGWMNERNLKTKVFGRMLSTPVGFPAGFDPDGDSLDCYSSLGMGLIELGTITPDPQFGENKPRVFKLDADKGLISRTGDCNRGADNLVEVLKRFEPERHKGLMVGVNVGTADTTLDPYKDYSTSIRLVAPYVDYVCINVKAKGARDLRFIMNKTALARIIKDSRKTLAEVSREEKTKLFLKLSPDLSEEFCSEIVQVILDPETAVDGLVLTGGTTDRSKVTVSPYRGELGEVSGKPLMDKSTNAIRFFYNATDGKIPIIGVGGVFSGSDAFEKIANGATAVQLYTAVSFEGLGVVKKIRRELSQALRENGFNSVNEAVGSKAKLSPPSLVSLES